MCPSPQAHLRPLVPYFVSGSLDLNAELEPEHPSAAPPPTTVHVRAWDRATGVFVDPVPVSVAAAPNSEAGHDKPRAPVAPAPPERAELRAFPARTSPPRPSRARARSARATSMRTPTRTSPSRSTPIGIPAAGLRSATPFASIATPSSAPTGGPSLLTPAAICARRAQRTASAPSSPTGTPLQACLPSPNRVIAASLHSTPLKTHPTPTKPYSSPFLSPFRPPPPPVVATPPQRVSSGRPVLPPAKFTPVRNQPPSVFQPAARYGDKRGPQQPAARYGDAKSALDSKFAGSSFDGMAPEVSSIKIPRAAATAAAAVAVVAQQARVNTAALDPSRPQPV